MPLTLGDQIGRIIGAPPATVCMHQNVSVAEAEIGERNRIVYERENFPSVRYVYQARRDLAVSATDDVVAAIDERTLLGPVQHLLFGQVALQRPRYVRPGPIERLEPAVTGWQAHARTVRVRA